jgi:membrane protein YqaA with SNARE-associated domain
MRPLLRKAAFKLAAYGPWGIFLLAALDSLGVPLPAAVDLLLAGTAAANAHAPVRAYGAAVLAIVGSLGGNFLLFQAARHGGRLFGKPSVAPGGNTRFQAWFERYGLLTVLVPAVTPVVPLPLKVFVVSAGVMRVPFTRFLGVILVARTIRYFSLAWLGVQLGADAPAFLQRSSWMLAAGALVLGTLLVSLMRWQRNRRPHAPLASELPELACAPASDDNR